MEDASSCHSHLHLEYSKPLTRALWIAFFFMILEVIGGWIANSLALLSDAMHLFLDVGALLLSIIAAYIARRPSTPHMSFGYHRAEILGALASSLSLWALSAILIYEAIKRLFHPEVVEGPLVLVIAAVGLCANLLMMRVLHPTQGHCVNVKAAYLHVIGDLLGSIGVILSGLILWLTNWNFVDPLITILFTCAILYSSGKIIKQTLLILMECAPKHLDIAAIRQDLLSLPGVKEVHDLHIWSISPRKTALSAHIVATDLKGTLQKAHRVLEEKYEIHHMTIQMEDSEHFESKFCYDCSKI